MTQQLVRTAFSPADPTYSVNGLESVFDYNGITLHNRVVGPECYCVTEIGGLDDAELRDARDVRPADHGEVAYDAFYGGRTLTFSGYILAGNLAMLKQMEFNLKRAVGSLVEMPLTIRRWGVNDTFSFDSRTLYTADAGLLSDLAVGASGLVVNSSPTIEKRLVRTADVPYGIDELYGTLKVTPGSTINGFKSGIIAKRVSSSTYIVGYVTDNGSVTSLKIDKVVGGVVTPVFTTTLTDRITANTPFWIRLFTNSPSFSIEYWKSEPVDFTRSDQESGPVSITDSAFRTGIRTFSGISFKPQDSLASVNSFKVNAGGAYGDLQINCRKGAAVSIKETQTTKDFRREFLITLRASYPFFESTYLAGGAHSGYVDALSLSSKARKYDKIYNYGYSYFIDSNGDVAAGGNDLTVVNLGNFTSRPILRLTGQLLNPSIVNNTNDEVMRITAEITSDEFYDIDIRNRTIVDNLGNNRFQNLSPTSDWLLLETGINNLSLFTQETGGSLQVWWRHTSN